MYCMQKFYYSSFFFAFRILFFFFFSFRMINIFYSIFLCFFFSLSSHSNQKYSNTLWCHEYYGAGCCLHTFKKLIRLENCLGRKAKGEEEKNSLTCVLYLFHFGFGASGVFFCDIKVVCAKMNLYSVNIVAFDKEQSKIYHITGNKKSCRSKTDRHSYIILHLL